MDSTCNRPKKLLIYFAVRSKKKLSRFFHFQNWAKNTIPTNLNMNDLE